VKSFTTLYPAIQDNSRHMVEVNLDALRRIGIHPQSDEDKHTLLCPVTRQKPLWPKNWPGLGSRVNPTFWFTRPRAGCLRPGYQKAGSDH
jgi:hypothetical protein